ncbi:MAG: S9 family peptidase [Bacteroidota bacterium]|nr:S9 family peptidase [Bacteroidota bacterium]
MNKIIVFGYLICLAFQGFCQNKMTPELLWKLGRVSGLGISKDGKSVVYSVATPSVAENKTLRETFVVPVSGGAAVQTFNQDSVMRNKNISPNGKYIIYNKPVKINKVTGIDLYPELTKSNAFVFTDLNYRHWDKWNDGTFDHVFIAKLVNGKIENEKDIMQGEPYDCPQKPFGGDEDYIWSRDSKYVVYVSKKKFGKEYALSTNTDLYRYDVETGKTINLTEGMMGYDINPEYNKQGTLAWLSMRRDGFESDKQDLIVMFGYSKINLTEGRDDLHVEGFKWSEDGKKLFFLAPVKATEQLFEVTLGGPRPSSTIRQITKGEFAVSAIAGQAGNTLIATKVDMNHAPELYSIDITSGEMKQITHVNDNIYNTIGMCKAERRFVKTTDNQQMPTWIIYPPDFDANKKYPTLLFCLGGPQGTTPLYSFRWNFQLMASQGYIVVAPDRRGVFGNGTKWTQDISKNWGGQAMNDYLSAIDDISKEKFVDKNRRGCVGASFGGYSVFMLEALHNGRFKTFISHDGVFDLKSMSGTTEELWFTNWDIGGYYWDTKNKAAQKSFEKYSPSNFVDKWNTPIMIVQGGMDYRVPIEQGLQAFQVAQLKGIKSKLLYLPTENHWVLSAQNAMVWQHEFFKWLDETLK